MQILNVQYKSKFQILGIMASKKKEMLGGWCFNAEGGLQLIDVGLWGYCDVSPHACCEVAWNLAYVEVVSRLRRCEADCGVSVAWYIVHSGSEHDSSRCRLCVDHCPVVFGRGHRVDQCQSDVGIDFDGK